MFSGWTLNDWLTAGVLSILGILALWILGVLFVGLFRARSLFRRELGAYFTSPVAYLVLFVFLVATGLLFLRTLGQLTTTGPEGVEYPLREMFGAAFFQAESPTWAMFGRLIFWAAFPLIPALLTMRLFAEERSSGTLEMLMTAPVKEWQVVLIKFLACFTFYLLLWIPTLLYLPVLTDMNGVWHGGEPGHSLFALDNLLTLIGFGLIILGVILLVPRFGNQGRLISLAVLVIGIIVTTLALTGTFSEPDQPRLLEVNAGIDSQPVWTTYLGMILIGAMFLSIGLFASSLVNQQLVAALIALGISLLFVIGVAIQPLLNPGDFGERLVYYFSVPSHFQQTFTRGLIDTRHVTLYVSVTVFCLFLTIRSLERRRWS